MNMRLLIVDDHPSTRELIKQFLNLPGITFRECASGEEAVVATREFKPHWVTMDVQMPGLNGFETTKAVRREHPGARVVIISAFSEPHFRELARLSGAIGFILKENILALRLMLEGETGNVQPALCAAGGSN